MLELASCPQPRTMGVVLSGAISPATVPLVSATNVDTKPKAPISCRSVANLRSRLGPLSRLARPWICMWQLLAHRPDNVEVLAHNSRCEKGHGAFSVMPCVYHTKYRVGLEIIANREIDAAVAMAGISRTPNGELELLQGTSTAWDSCTRRLFALVRSPWDMGRVVEDAWDHPIRQLDPSFRPSGACWLSKLVPGLFGPRLTAGVAWLPVILRDTKLPSPNTELHSKG